MTDIYAVPVFINGGELPYWGNEERQAFAKLSLILKQALEDNTQVVQFISIDRIRDENVFDKSLNKVVTKINKNIFLVYLAADSEDDLKSLLRTHQNVIKAQKGTLNFSIQGKLKHSEGAILELC